MIGQVTAFDGKSPVLEIGVVLSIFLLQFLPGPLKLGMVILFIFDCIVCKKKNSLKQIHKKYKFELTMIAFL